MNNINGKNGFTLIELLVYIGVSTIFLLAVSAFAFTLLGTHQQTKVYHETDRELHFALDQLVWRIEQAYNVDGQGSFSQNIAATGDGIALSYQDPLLDPTRISVSGNIIVLEIAGEPAIPLTGQQYAVNNLTFTDLSTPGGSRNIGILLSLSRSVGYGLPDAIVTQETSVEIKDYAP